MVSILRLFKIFVVDEAGSGWYDPSSEKHRRYGELKKLRSKKEQTGGGRVELEEWAKMAEQGLTKINQAKEAAEQAMQSEIAPLKQAVSLKESELNSAWMQAELYKSHSNSFFDARWRFISKLLQEAKSTRLEVVADFLGSPAFGFSKMLVKAENMTKAFSDCLAQLKRANLLRTDFEPTPE